MSASLWVTTEVGTIHRACGADDEKLAALGQRHIDARVASGYEVGPCCRTEDIACAFDVFGERHDIDQVVILAYALARAEGREMVVGQPYRCAVHGAMTFGGCCEAEQSDTARSERPPSSSDDTKSHEANR